jgi:hypothetical protein
MRPSRLVSLWVLLVMCVAAGLSLVAAPGASAQSPGRHHFVLSSHARGVSGGELAGEDWAITIGRPSTAPPPHCELLGHGRILYIGHHGPCSVRAGVPVFVGGLGTAWTNLDPGLTSDPREQARLATENDRATIKKETITIDGCGPINFRTPRFEVLSRQFRVWMPEPNFFGVPAQEVNYVAHGWSVVIQGLRPGRHLIRTDFTVDFGVPEHFSVDYVVDVLPRR